MGFSNDDDPYGAMFAAADEEQRQKAAASDKEWAARGVVKVAPEPEEEKEPSEPESKVNWPRGTQSKKKGASELGAARAVVTPEERGATSIEVAMLGIVAECDQRVLAFQSTEVLARSNML